MRQDDYDSYEDFEEAQEAKERTKRVPAKRSGGEVSTPAPEPIVYQGAVLSFTKQYQATPYWGNNSVEYLTLGDLRKIFAAVVPFGVPDAMPTILDFLGSHSFVLETVPGFSEPVMSVYRTPIEGVVEDDRYITL